VISSLNKAKLVYDKCKCKSVKDIEDKLEEISIEDVEYEIEEYSKLLLENSDKISKYQVEYESVMDILIGLRKASEV
jgi:hypothetical protein